jgi:Domain of unknown function (DUF6908)
MKTVAKIIELYGGLDWLRQLGNYIRLENPPFMRLVIEHIGAGPRGRPAISVAHYYEHAGDAMRDPEMVFEINPDADGPLSWKTGDWAPVSFQQDNAGFYQEAVFVTEDGQVMVRPKIVLQLKAFARGWDGNIRQQGFLRVAESSARERSGA